MPFGQHKGKEISDLPKPYLKWMKENFDWEDRRNRGLKMMVEEALNPKKAIQWRFKTKDDAIKDMIDLANVLEWHTKGKFPYQVNFINDSKDMISVYWNKKFNEKLPRYKVTYKTKKGKLLKRDNVSYLLLERIFTEENIYP